MTSITVHCSGNSNTINTVMAENFPNQPDFAAAAHALQTVGNELAKCSNLPTVQEGEAIIDIIQGIERHISAQVQFEFSERFVVTANSLTLDNSLNIRQQFEHSATV
jgi:hypothetical protein